MGQALLLIASISLFLGHLFKMLRWRQFTTVYEDCGRKLLLRSLAYGYLVNFILPFRVGDVVRAVWAGRRMENGTVFSLATVVLDRCLDVWVVGFLFGMVFFTGNAKASTKETLVFYIVLALILMALLILAFCFSKTVKKLAKFICSIFNEKIELSLLVFLWSGITAVKDMLKRINKVRLFSSTALMWCFYLLSYYTMAMSLSTMGSHITFFEIFTLLFGSNQINMSAFMLFQTLGKRTALLMSIYILTPLLLMMVVSLLPSGVAYKLDEMSGVQPGTSSVLHLLPQVKAEDKLLFLEKYFESESKEYLETYIRLNRDVMILGDFSAGSNATTMLCMDKESSFYRKYAFGGEAKKLLAQVEWLEDHSQSIPLPSVIRKQADQMYCCYDMPYYSTAIGLFHYLHSTGTEEGWKLLETVLEDINLNLHQKSRRPADRVMMEQYIDQKVWKNIEKIEAARELRPLLYYETLIINGKSCRGFPFLKQYMDSAILAKVFGGDQYSDIHGDLTIENIICWKKEHGADYYLIDPGMGSLHESPFLDYSKLLQSLHGNYEFLMRTSSVDLNGNKIDYLSTVSQRYGEIFLLYKRFLEERFTAAQNRSIYFHEIVHWLRLMPYKIEKNGKRAVLFFSGLILIFNDIVDWYGEL